MAQVNVITDMDPDERPCVRMFAGDKTLAVVTSPRRRPRMILPDLRGYYLGLFDSHWASHTPRDASGGGAYWVKIAPRFSGLSDNDGDSLRGTYCQAIDSEDVIFEVFPDGYACDGYFVYANDSGATDPFFLQGELDGRWNNRFTITAPAGGGTFEYDPVLRPWPAPDTTIGPPAWASQCEVYQGEGNIQSRVYLAGGKDYRRGYATVSRASLPPLVTGSTAAESDVAVWNLVTAGAFRIRIDNEWYDIPGLNRTGINFSGAADMAAVATLIETAINASYPAISFNIPTTEVIATWNDIANGAFDVWIESTKYSVRDCDFSGCTDMAGVAAVVEAAIRVQTGGSETFEWVNSKFILETAPGAAAESWLSYLYTPSDGAGTDISELLGGRETSADVVLNRVGYGGGAAIVTWATDHFTIQGAGALLGAEYRLSLLASPSGGDYTDISGADYMCCRGDEAATAGKTKASYRPGQTAYLSVIGDDCNWGEWAEGMRIAFDGESDQHLVDRYVSSTHLVLDSEYEGIAVNRKVAYTLIPWSDQVYPSELANPFDYQPDTIVKVATATNDEIVGLRVVGRNLGIWMRHHVHVLDAVSPLTPRLVSNKAGAVTSESIVWDGVKYVWFDGNEFWSMKWNAVEPLDPEGRMRDIVARINPAKLTSIVGAYDSRQNQRVVIWSVALDDSELLDYAIVNHSPTGNWWLRRYNDANALACVEDDDGAWALYSGSTYDLYGAGVNAFVFKHGDEDYSDGAQPASDGKDKYGVVMLPRPAPGGVIETNTAPRLNFDAKWGGLTALQTITNGAFQIEIDGTWYTVTGLNLSGCATIAATATAIQNALLASGAPAGTTCAAAPAVSATAMLIKGPQIDCGSVSFMRAYEPDTYQDVTTYWYLDGREWDSGATQTKASAWLRIGLLKPDKTAAAMNTADGEHGIWMYTCDANYENGRFVFVENTLPGNVDAYVGGVGMECDWLWFIGGIDPTWEKWFDFGAPHIKHNVRELAVTCAPQDTEHIMAVHEMHNLSETVRVTLAMTFGAAQDVTQTKRFSDRPTTHAGVRLHRPSSTLGLEVESLVLTHRSEV